MSQDVKPGAPETQATLSSVTCWPGYSESSVMAGGQMDLILTLVFRFLEGDAPVYPRAGPGSRVAILLGSGAWWLSLKLVMEVSESSSVS